MMATDADQAHHCFSVGNASSCFEEGVGLAATHLSLVAKDVGVLKFVSQAGKSGRF